MPRTGVLVWWHPLTWVVFPLAYLLYGIAKLTTGIARANGGGANHGRPQPTSGWRP